jgi:hypothetical protein
MFFFHFWKELQVVLSLTELFFLALFCFLNTTWNVDVLFTFLFFQFDQSYHVPFFDEQVQFLELVVVFLDLFSRLYHMLLQHFLGILDLPFSEVLVVVEIRMRVFLL